MSTALLYHGFGIRGYHYQKSEYQGGKTIFTIGQERRKWRCPACGSKQVIGQGQVARRFKTLPIGSKPVFLDFAVPRVKCQECGAVQQVEIRFAEPRRHYTRAFERYALELSRHMTIQDVARHLGVSWDVIKDIQKRYLNRRFSRPKLKHLRQIALDEIAIGKGHRYLTVVLDLLTGAVVFVGEGKGEDALRPFWKRLRSARAEIEAVAMDMSPAYLAAVLQNLPSAVIVFDHFHVIKLFNHHLSQFRRELHRETNSLFQKEILKGTRWLLLKNPEHLDPRRNERERLEQALRLNQPLATAYYLKEDLRQFWAQPDPASAARFLEDWAARARVSGIRFLIKFANTLIAHRSGLLAYYQYPISTGPLEGVNNKIQTMKRQAYGFRDLV